MAAQAAPLCLYLERGHKAQRSPTLWEQISLMTLLFFTCPVHALNLSCFLIRYSVAQECHSLSQGSGIERRKGEGEGNWRERKLGWLERTKQGAISAIWKSSRPLIFRALEQNTDSQVIQEGRGLCPAVGYVGGRETISTSNPHLPGNCGHGA